MDIKLVELVGLTIILVMCGTVYVVAGPAALAAVAGVASTLYVTWRGTRHQSKRR